VLYEDKVGEDGLREDRQTDRAEHCSTGMSTSTSAIHWLYIFTRVASTLHSHLFIHTFVFNTEQSTATLTHTATSDGHSLTEKHIQLKV